MLADPAPIDSISLLLSARQEHPDGDAPTTRMSWAARTGGNHGRSDTPRPQRGSGIEKTHGGSPREDAELNEMVNDIVLEPPPSADCSGWHSIGAVTDWRREGDTLHLDCGTAAVRIIPERAGIVRVRLAPDGRFGRDHSWAVIDDDTPQTTWTVEEEGDTITLVTDRLRVCIQRVPCRISFHDLDGTLIGRDDPSQGMAWDGGDIACWKTLAPEDHVFGLGEKGQPFDKRNTTVLNWNDDASEHGPWSDPLYQSHPFALMFNRGRAYGLFFDNTYRSWFDFGKLSRTRFGFGADGGELDYYFIPGPAPAEVVQRYARLVGTTPLPPLWSLGYQQCRWSYDTAARIRALAREFRRRKIPCDTIYIDIDYMDGFRCFTWDPKRFARPERLMKDLAGWGFKAVTILDPGIKVDPGYAVYDAGKAGGHFCRTGDDRPYVGRVWPGETVYPDFTRSGTRRWWGRLYRGLIDAGVTGFWNDMNEPSDFSQPDGVCPLDMQHDNDGHPSDHRAAHNVYGMQMARATFDGMKNLRPGERPFVLTRAGFAGVQRYAAVWTGDNRSSWEYLRMSLPMLLNMSLSGITFCGADIGGFFSVPSAELFTRWLQLGIFYPLCRVHTCAGPEQDPWGYGPKHERLNRAAIELRYRLLPYLYTELRHSSNTGLPLLRPLLLDYPDEPDVHKCRHEFLFGRQLFVAPVLEEGAKTRETRLPPGKWFDLADGTPRAGGDLVTLAVDISSIPVFARAGAIIPMRDIIQYTGEKPLDELILHVFPGDGAGAFYNDDGRSYDYRRGECVSEHYETTTTRRDRSLRLVRRDGEDGFAPKTYRLVFHGVRRMPRAVTTGDATLPRAASPQSLRRRASAWIYDRTAHIVRVRLPQLAPGDAVRLLTHTKTKTKHA